MTNQALHIRRLVFVSICLCVSLLLFTQLFPVKFVFTQYKQYVSDIIEFNALALELKKASVIKTTKMEKGELYVIVIGESEGRDFMHSYLGPYPNTPWRDSIAGNDNWIIFRNAYSTHTHTVPVLTASLSEGRELTGRVFPGGLNILNISRNAGISTYWMSNQAALGPWDSPITALAYQADKTIFTSPKSSSFNLMGPKPDECLIPFLKQTLEHLDFSQNNLIIIHLMGSHGPFRARYPKDFPELDVSAKALIGGTATNSEIVEQNNHYLTSIMYTDHVLKQIFSTISSYDALPAFMLYFSDHGSDIFSKGSDHDFSNFTWSMARIPMMIWLSDQYRSRYPEITHTLKNNSDRIFTNDLIYDLYTGLTNIKIDGASQNYDLSRPSYILNLQNAVIAEKKRIIDDPFLITAQNVTNSRGQVAMHRANTIFKAVQGQKLGINSLEVDLIFKEDETLGDHFIVGHDDKSLTDISLDNYLKALASIPDFIWFDIKNLTVKNADGVLQAMENLNHQHGLKAIALIGSDTSAALAAFSQSCWRTSYYLPWQELINSAENLSASVFEKVAEAVRQNNIQCVSYDLKADDAVKTRLQPLLPPDTLFYAWSVEYNFNDPELLEKLENLNHLEKLLVTFSSPYNL